MADGNALANAGQPALSFPSPSVFAKNVRVDLTPVELKALAKAYAG